MKTQFASFCAVATAFAAVLSWGHTAGETNAVLGAALARAYTYYDDLPGGSPPDDDPPPDTWRGFLGPDTNGWTLVEKMAAFDWYLSTLGTNDCQSMDHFGRTDVMVAVGKCEQFDYTNSAPALKALALNPRGIMRDEAINLAVRFSPVDDTTTEFVETIITNVHGYSSGERVGCYWEYAKKLRQDPCINGAYANAISMFYRNRKVDSTGAVTLDRLFSDKITGYAQSSNRLDTALFMLSVTNMRPRFAEHFTSVTNQLLSSGQPLPWIEVGAGSN